MLQYAKVHDSIYQYTALEFLLKCSSDSVKTQSAQDVSGLAMEDALKVLLSSVNRASQD